MSDRVDTARFLDGIDALNALRGYLEGVERLEQLAQRASGTDASQDLNSRSVGG